MTPQQHAAKHEVVICSIVPFALPACRRPLYTPVSDYALEPASAENPFHLLIRDAWQPEYRGENAGNQQLMVLAERIAHDVVQDYTERIPGWASDQHLGVFVCAGERATPEEIATAVAKQDKFYAHSVEIADTQYRRDGTAKNIRTLARESAIALKLDRVWLYEVKSSDTKTCPECGESIKATANTCKHCNTKGLLARAAKEVPAVTPPLSLKEPRLVGAQA